MNPVARWLSTWWLNRMASVAVLFDRKSQAIASLRKIIEIDSRNEMARAAIGNLYAEEGDQAAALKEFLALVELNPRNAEAWFNLGYIYDQRDELENAERCFRKAVELRPSIDRAWYGLGLVLVRQRRLGEAIDAFRRTIKLQSMSPYGYYQLGMTYHHLGRNESAAKVYEALKKFEPRYAATLKRDMEITVPQALDLESPEPSSKEGTETESI